MGKENSEIRGSRTEEQGCSNCQRTGAIAGWKKFLCRGSAGCGWKTASGSRGCVEVQIHLPDLSRRHARRISRFGRFCPLVADREISGEQANPTDSADCERKRRRARGKRAGRWQRCQQDQRGAYESAGALELNRRSKRKTFVILSE